MSCEKCGGEGWIVRERKGISGVEPCECRRSGPGSTRFNERGIPLNQEAAGAHIAMLCDCLAFPPGALGRALIVDALMDMCSTEDESLWVVKQAVSLYTKWTDCGVPGLRQIVTSFRVPKDGVELSFTDAFPEGIPSVKPIAAPSLPRLPAGRAFTADPQIEAGMRRLLEAHPRLDELAKLPPAERKRTLEFERILDDLEMGQDSLPEIKRKPIKQSEVLPLHEDDPVHAPRAEGTYQKITRENFDALLRLEQDEKKKAGK